MPGDAPAEAVGVRMPGDARGEAVGELANECGVRKPERGVRPNIGDCETEAAGEWRIGESAGWRAAGVPGTEGAGVPGTDGAGVPGTEVDSSPCCDMIAILNANNLA